MKIPPSYSITPQIMELLIKIEALQEYFSTIKVPSALKKKLQRVSILKSSLFSARIEGNPLSEEDIITSRNIYKKREVENIMYAYQFIEKNITQKKALTKDILLQIHSIIMNNLVIDNGKYRNEMGAIFNQTGTAIYVSPPPKEINGLIDQLFQYINNNTEKFPLIKAFIAHVVFEKIHPFTDGNGRVGRLLIQTILQSSKYSFPTNIAFEEYIDHHKNDYYYSLDVGMKNTNEYLCFMLNAFYSQVEKLKKQLANQMASGNKVLLLPPRQEEIYLITKEHTVVSFDIIRRRFLKVPERTLRYDLKKLVEKGYVVKIGTTKGVFYKVKPE